MAEGKIPPIWQNKEPPQKPYDLRSNQKKPTHTENTQEPNFLLEIGDIFQDNTPQFQENPPNPEIVNEDILPHPGDPLAQGFDLLDNLQILEQNLANQLNPDEPFEAQSDPEIESDQEEVENNLNQEEVENNPHFNNLEMANLLPQGGDGDGGPPANEVGLSRSKDAKSLSIITFCNTSLENAASWLDTFLHKLRALGFQDARAAQIFPLLLGGECMNWHESLEDGVKQNFPQVIQAFKTRYITGGVYQTQDNRTKFYQATQTPGESVKQFAQRLREIAQRTGIDDDDSLRIKFLSGLQPQIRDKIHLFQSANYAEAQELAQAAEGQLPPQLQLNAIQTQQWDGEVSCLQAILDKIESLAVKVDKTQTAVEPSKTPVSKRVTFDRPTSSRGRSPEPSPREQISRTPSPPGWPTRTPPSQRSFWDNSPQETRGYRERPQWGNRDSIGNFPRNQQRSRSQYLPGRGRNFQQRPPYQTQRQDRHDSCPACQGTGARNPQPQRRENAPQPYLN